MIDRFTRTHFEAALPQTTPVISMGLQEGEYSYKIPVARTPFAILIRSSVDSTGMAAETGADSIRCWIVMSVSGEAWGAKIAKYVTRVRGWEDRLTHTLRELWKMCLAIEKCPVCGQWMKVFKVKKEGPNKGRVFIKCVKCEAGPMKFPQVA